VRAGAVASWPALRWAIVAVVVLIALIAALDWLPDRYAYQPSGLDGKDREAQIAENRGRVTTATLTFYAGLIAVFGAWYTARTFRLNQTGQLTERYTRAVDQLGHESTDVRIGGIYALERIAQESRTDHVPILEILTAYVREHSPVIPKPDDAKRSKGDIRAAMRVIGRRDTTHDRRATTHDETWLDLRATDLARLRMDGAKLAGASLADAALNDSSLEGADLRGALLNSALADNVKLKGARMDGARGFVTFLRGADLTSAQLPGVELPSAQLERAYLIEANLAQATLVKAAARGAAFVSANLNGADLSEGDFSPSIREQDVEVDTRQTSFAHADLAGAVFRGANLQRAKLYGADISGADFTGADIRGADLRSIQHWETANFSDVVDDNDTEWPVGLTPPAQE
jgi:uncharacterized protein YjbI with pentapeptide repeats